MGTYKHGEYTLVSQCYNGITVFNNIRMYSLLVHTQIVGFFITSITINQKIENSVPTGNTEEWGFKKKPLKIN